MGCACAFGVPPAETDVAIADPKAGCIAAAEYPTGAATVEESEPAGGTAPDHCEGAGATPTVVALLGCGAIAA